jgi:hypothetical protein
MSRPVIDYEDEVLYPSDVATLADGQWLNDAVGRQLPFTTSGTRDLTTEWHQ